MIFLNLLIIFLFLSFPILLWGYGSIYLSENIWNRNRFFFGLLGGSISVIIIALFGKSGFFGSDIIKLLSFILIFLLGGLLVWWVTKKGSPFIRGFLRKTLILHSVLFMIIFGSFLLIQKFYVLPTSLIISLTGLSSFLIAASIEEGVKHVSALGLTSKEFRFTRRDFLLFTFFVTLGFTTFENGIYLFGQIHSGLGSLIVVGITRIFFSGIIHVFSASICVMFWWKALSYKFFSFQYIFYFILGYLGATLIHAVYNWMLDKLVILPILLLTLIGYYLFTLWISQSDE